MYAPVCTRFLTYDCHTIMAFAHMQQWIAAAKAEPDELEELDMEF
jgi:glutathione S-transferase